MVQVLYESYPYVRETESDLTPESILVDDVVVLLLYYRIILMYSMDGMIMCANTPFCSCTRSEGILC